LSDTSLFMVAAIAAVNKDVSELAT
jgi:hypothetical protein